MSPDLLVENLIRYSVQVLLLVTAGSLLPRLFRIRHPRTELIWYHCLLAACLLLPMVQTWDREVIHITPVTPAKPDIMPMAQPAPVALSWTWEEWTIAGLATGAGFRALWLVLGLLRLRRYRRTAKPIWPLPPAFVAAQCHVGTPAAMFVSKEIEGPVTFGFIDPLVLVPASTLDLPVDAQRAVLVHELLHVRRHDWLWVLCEEIISVALWFHPAVWWLTSRIRLAREEAVDREVVTLVESREPYVDALLAMAKVKVGPDLAPAPPFARGPNLVQRVRSILNEVNMSQRRLLLSYVSATAIVGVTVWFAAQSFPLKAAPQWEVRDSAGVTVQSAPLVVHRAGVAYPLEARNKRIEGAVVLEAQLAASGSVIDARVVSGPSELRRAALESLLQWHFQNDDRSEKRVAVTIEFKLPAQAPAGVVQGVIQGGIQGVIKGTPGVPPPPPPASGMQVLETIDLSWLPAAAREKLEARLAPYRGRQVSSQLISEINQIIKEVEEHAAMLLRGTTLTVLMHGVPPPPPPPPAASVEAGSSFPPGDGPRIRVGGHVQSVKLRSQDRPVYPSLARQARIQGVVRFGVLIGVDGDIKHMQLISGHPLLVEAAQKAVQTWTYETTLLNGNPVEVITQVDVNFTLTE